MSKGLRYAFVCFCLAGFPAALRADPISEWECAQIVRSLYRETEEGPLAKERTRRKSLMPLARKMLSRIESRARGYVARNLGRDALGRLERIVEASGDPHLQDLARLLAEEAVDLALDTPESTREALVRTPFFLNFYETKRSSCFGPGLEERAVLESSLLGLRMLAYAELPQAVKPKYGYLRPAEGTTISGQPLRPVITAYGDDTFVFRKRKVLPFTTWYFGDSLNRRSEYGLGDYATWLSTGTRKPERWNQVWFPWGSRLLLLLGLEKPVKSDQELAVYRIHVDPRTFILSSRKEQIQSANERLRFDLNLPTQSYVELQFWKPDLSLDDVEIFEFRSQPPTGAFLEALERRNILIRDGR